MSIVHDCATLWPFVEAGFSRALLRVGRRAALKRASTKSYEKPSARLIFVFLIPVAHFPPNGFGVVKGCTGARLHLESRFVDLRRVEDARV